MDATNKNSSGKIGRKFGSAMKALRDFDVLKDWIWEQVIASSSLCSSSWFETDL